MKIKTLIIALLAAVIAIPVFAQKNSQGKPAIEFAEKAYDFGTVKASKGMVEHEFVFTNTGDAPLLIVSAKADCGCTRPKFDAAPVKPGKKGKIKVTFLTEGQRGYISKVIKLRTNAPSAKRISLKITGNVVPDNK